MYITSPCAVIGAWEDRWVQSKKKSDYGKFKLTAGEFYGDAEKDKGMDRTTPFWVCGSRVDSSIVRLTLSTSAGIQTSENAHFYALSSRFSEPFNNEGKTLVVQFSVKHEQSIDCGGGYIKVFPSSLDQEQMEGESEYNIMFGEDAPDVLGIVCRHTCYSVLHVVCKYLYGFQGFESLLLCNGRIVLDP